LTSTGLKDELLLTLGQFNLKLRFILLDSGRSDECIDFYNDVFIGVYNKYSKRIFDYRLQYFSPGEKVNLVCSFEKFFLIVYIPLATSDQSVIGLKAKIINYIFV